MAPWGKERNSLVLKTSLLYESRGVSVEVGQEPPFLDCVQQTNKNTFVTLLDSDYWECT